MRYAGRTFYRPIATNLRTTIEPLSLIAVAAESSPREARVKPAGKETRALNLGHCIADTVSPGLYSQKWGEYSVRESVSPRPLIEVR